MKIKEQRLLKKLEKEPVKGLINTQDHFYPGLQTYKEQKDEFCICREYKQEDGSKRYIWCRMALEAKIVLGEDMIISFDTEFIENNAEDAERQKKNECRADQAGL